MENNNQRKNKFIVKAIDILKKLKSSVDRRNFELENNKHFYNNIY